jgi:ATP synthase protein I
MQTPDDSSREGLSRLDRGLETFEAARAKKKTFPIGGGMEASEGFRLLSQLLGGVLGGAGLGWLIDYFARTGPLGLIGGLVIGSGLSIYAMIRAASAISARETAKAGPFVPVPPNYEEDEKDD